MKFTALKKTSFLFRLTAIVYLLTTADLYSQSDGSSVDGKAQCLKKGFKMEYSVSILMDAPLDRIWNLLTHAEAYPEWNSTVQRIDGKIAEGQKIRLTATIAPERTFTLKVRDVISNRSMTWKDGAAPMFRGVRTYLLEKVAQDKVRFTMKERFAGLMVPMIAGSLPDFRKPFEDFARDLKKAAE